MKTKDLQKILEFRRKLHLLVNDAALMNQEFLGSYTMLLQSIENSLDEQIDNIMEEH